MLKESRHSQTLPEANADEIQLIIQNLKSCLITAAISEPDPGLQRDRKRGLVGGYMLMKVSSSSLQIKQIMVYQAALGLLIIDHTRERIHLTQ